MDGKCASRVEIQEIKRGSATQTPRPQHRGTQGEKEMHINTRESSGTQPWQ